MMIAMIMMMMMRRMVIRMLKMIRMMIMVDDADEDRLIIPAITLSSAMSKSSASASAVA